MDHAIRRHNLWYAVLTVPKELRQILGRARFSQSTKSGKDSISAPRVGVLIAQWQAEIEAARGTLTDPRDTFWHDIRKEYASALDADEAEEGEGGALSLEVLDIIRDAALKIKDREHSSFMYRTAVGDLLTLHIHAHASRVLR